MPKGIKYFVTTDTHFAHGNIVKWCQRKTNCEELIMKRLVHNIGENDILIHLGDVAWKNELEWHERFLSEIPAKKKWLVKGNHDKRTNTWYLERGWDSVCDALLLNVYGKRVLLTHIPYKDLGYFDINIHGHFHNSDYKKNEPEIAALLTDRHILIKLEHEYKPYILRSLIENKKNQDNR